MSAAAPGPDAPRGVIGVLIVAAFVVILNETTMNVALSSIMASLGVTERTAQWLTTAFLLTMAVVIPVTGWLLDRLTTRQVFTIAMTTFTVGTVVCALAPGFPVLLIGRIVQASGTAVMMPLLMTTVMRLVPSETRGAMMGNISMVIAVAPAIGPTLSGVLLQLGSWRYVFCLVAPVAAVMLLLGRRRLVNVGHPVDTPLDLISIPLTILAFGPLVYGLSLIGAEHVAWWQPWLAVGIGVGALVAFVARQLVLQGRDAAFLDLRTFTVSSFTVSVVMMAVAMMALFGTIIMLPLLLQRAFGLAPLQVGLMLLPGGIAMGLLSPVVGRLYDRLGPRVLVVPASLAVLAVFAFLSTISLATPWWAVMASHIVLSLGFACLFTPLFTVGLGSLPESLYAHGSAVMGAMQQVAGAAGTAVFVTIFATQSAAASVTAPSEAAAMLVGAHWAFLGAGAIWTAGVVCSFFVRRPAEELAPAEDAHA